MVYKIGFQDSDSSFDDVVNFVENNFEIQVDTETTGFDPHSDEILLIQLGNYDNQFVINALTVDYLKLKELLERKDKLFIFHNAKFDLRFFLHKGIKIFSVFDTFLAECLLTAGYDREEQHVSLADVSNKYLNVKLDKSVRAHITKVNYTNEHIINYAALDVKYLSQIKELQMVEIKKWQIEETLNLENQVVRVFAQMEYDGVLIDQEKWIEVARKVESQTFVIEEELDNIVETDEKLHKFAPKSFQGNMFFQERKSNINWSSNVQKLNILKEIVPELPSVGERELTRNKNTHKIFKKLIEYSKSKKLASAFGMNFLEYINPVTKRIHYDVWQILSTGRISVSNPNLNQIPSKGDLGKEIRSCFVASPGYVMVGGDFSGMELRIIAEFSLDPLWVSSFRDGKDLHSVLCAETFSIDIKDVKKETPFKAGVTYRDVQKTINFGLAYGMSKFKLADTMGITVEEADNIIKRFFKVVPKVESFLTSLGNYGKTRGYIRTVPPYNRVRIFPKWSKNTSDFAYLGEVERASKNMPIQGTNGDIIKLALVNLQNLIYENNYPVRILLSVYDEIQTECREDFAQEWKLIQDRVMLDAAYTLIKHIPVVVDSKINPCWSK